MPTLRFNGKTLQDVVTPPKKVQYALTLSLITDRTCRYITRSENHGTGQSYDRRGPYGQQYPLSLADNAVVPLYPWMCLCVRIMKPLTLLLLSLLLRI